MKTQGVIAKSVLTKSGLPGADWCINPYLGCEHSCVYCYAQFMRRFSGHENEDWGNFVDVKINAPEILKKELKRKKGKKLGVIHLGSVCDPWQPLERKYQLTRKILQELADYPADSFSLSFLTKSGLVTRDISLLKKIKNLEAGITITCLSSETQKIIEPQASNPEDRIRALKILHRAGLKTYVFVGPILPGLTNVEEIISRTKNCADEFWFENLNIRAGTWQNILNTIKKHFPGLEAEYLEMRKDYFKYWAKKKSEIAKFAKANNLKTHFVFDHKAQYD